MDIREALLAEHSKTQTRKIVDYIAGDAVKFKELMGHSLGDSYHLSQRAAGAVTYCAEYHRELVKPYFNKLVEQLERSDVHVAVRRNVVRMFQFIDIPKRYEGRVFDACYNLLDNPRESIAVRAFALTVAAKVAKDMPDLLNELLLVAKKYPQAASAGFRSRCQSVLGV